MFPTFIDLLNANSQKLKLQDRVNGIVGSMDKLSFQNEELDLIWSEGAIYNIGFERGINEWRRFLKPGGFIPEFEYDDEECLLSFSHMEGAVSTQDYLFKRILGVDPYEKDGRWEPYGDETYAGGDKIGGYACFAQEDPRVSTPAGENWLLLYQSDGTIGNVEWGDGGVGSCFIRDTDLQNRDFSHVALSWDCA